LATVERYMPVAPLNRSRVDQLRDADQAVVQVPVVEVFLELGPLAKRVRVLERERVQADQLRQPSELLLVGLAQVDPDEVAVL
jgi:hypothetical protein